MFFFFAWYEGSRKFASGSSSGTAKSISCINDCLSKCIRLIYLLFCCFVFRSCFVYLFVYFYLVVFYHEDLCHVCLFKLLVRKHEGEVSEVVTWIVILKTNLFSNFQQITIYCTNNNYKYE